MTVAELLQLPSGASIRLERPDPAAVVACGGGLRDLAATVIAHDGLTAEMLSDDDLLAVAGWALDYFLDSSVAVRLGELMAVAGDLASRRLGVEDRGLAYAVDTGCLDAYLTAPRR